MVTVRKGARLLNRFLDTREISIRNAGAALSVTHVAVNDWRKGKAVPGDANKAAIERWTGGEVPFDSWLSAKELKRRRTLEQIEPFSGKGSAVS